MNQYSSDNVLEITSTEIVTHVYLMKGYDEVLGFYIDQNERIKLELFRAAENNDI